MPGESVRWKLSNWVSGKWAIFAPLTIAFRLISLDTTSFAKTIVAVLLALLCAGLLWQQRRLMPALTSRDRLTRWAVFGLFRLAPFVLVYVVLGQEPRSDVEFFWVRAKAAFAGQWVYRDFLSYHAPLFSYITAIPLLIWYNPRVLVLFMAVVEFIIANATYRRYQTQTPDTLLRYVLYYALPLPVVAMVLSSEEDIWMWGFGLLTLSLAANRRFSFLAGLLWGAAMLTIKFMLVVLLIPVFFLIKDRFRYVVGLAVVGIPALVLLYGLMGLAFLMPIQHSEIPMAPNLLSVLRPVLGSVFGQTSLTSLNWVGLLLTIGLSSAAAWQVRHAGYHRMFPYLYCLVFCLFMLCLPSAPGYYLFAHELVLVMLVLRNSRTDWGRFILLNVLLVIQPIIWVVYGKMALYNSFSTLTDPIHLLDYGIQLTEVVLLLWLLRLTYRQLIAESRRATNDQLAYSPPPD